MTQQRIAVFRALNLGDMLCAVPALRALRKGLPGAQITLVGLPWAASFQRRYARYIDRFIAFPGYPGLPEAQGSQAAIDEFFSAMQAERFDLCLQMHGCGPVSNAVVQRFKGRRALGLGSAEGISATSPLEVLPYPENDHEIRRNLYLVRHGLGVACNDESPEFPLVSEDFEELAGYPELNACLGTPFVCLHPGARDPGKRWPTSHFAQVGDQLARQGLKIVITGSQAERALAQQVVDAMHHHAVNAACDISIGGLAALMSAARLLVSNDTGAAHIASGLRLPSVVIFFATDPLRWGPPKDGPHRIVYGSPLPDPDQVLDAAAELLSRQGAARESLNNSIAASSPSI